MKYLLMLLMLLMSSSVLAAVDLQAPENEKITNNPIVDFVFQSSLDASSCTLMLNGIANKSITDVAANTATAIRQILLDKTHTWFISCNNQNGVENSAQRAIKIDTVPPIVELIQPAHEGFLADSVVELAYIPTDPNLFRCSLFSNVNNNVAPLQTATIPISGSVNKFLTQFPDGSFTWNILCDDFAGNSMTSVISRTINIDTSAPKVLSYEPSTTTTRDSVTLTLTTNEQAKCKYSPGNNLTYSEMHYFDVTDSTSHTKFFTGLGDGVHTMFISCHDKLGNELSGKTISLDIHHLPTAKISLNQPVPLKTGLIKIKLTTSKNMNSPPILTYSLDSQQKSIALTGKDKEWEGTMLLEEGIGRKIGVFSFTGTDTKGFIGNVITEGKTFIVDTIKPSEPTNLKAILTSGYPKISWFSIDEDISHFNIYRLAQAGVTLADLYASVNSTEYTDLAAKDKVTYYYKIAGVDKAGNVGPLSAEIFSTSQTGIETKAEEEVKEEEVKTLPPNLVTYVTDAVNEIENIRKTVSLAASSLESLSGTEKEIANELGLLANANQAASTITALKSQAEQMKSDYMEEAELKSRLDSLKKEAKKLEQNTIKSLSITEQADFDTLATEEDYAIALHEFAGELNLNEGQKEKYLKQNLKIAETFRISTKVYILSLENVAGVKSERTFVSKGISYRHADELEDVVIIEIVPKTVAQTADHITFISPNPEVLNPDPVLKYGFFRLGYEENMIKYAVDRKISLQDAREIKTVPFTSLNELAQIPSTPTGLFVSPLGDTASIWPILAVLILVGGLAVYYYSPQLPKFGKKESILTSMQLRQISALFSKMNFTLDDMLYPVVMSVNQAIIEKTNLKGLGLSMQIIAAAQYYLALGNKDKAIKAYNAVSVAYKSLSKSEKERISDECLNLRNSLK